MNTIKHRGTDVAAQQESLAMNTQLQRNENATGESGAVDLPAAVTGEAAEAQALIRRLQQQVKDLDARLEHAAAEHAAEKRRLTGDLESFGRSVAHDLRNQVAVIHGFVHFLLQTKAGELNGSERDGLLSIAQSADQLSAMFDALLELARIEHRRPVHEWVDLAALADDIAKSLAQTYTGHVVKVFIADMPPVQGDPRLLRIALQNLMDNAWKYTSTVPHARVEVGCFSSEAGNVTYYVRDNGIGFPANEAVNAFLPFKRLSTAREFSGAGVGLATVKRIVEKHDGRVWAESGPGRGSSFLFTLRRDGT